MSNKFDGSGDNLQPDVQREAPFAESPSAGPTAVRCSCGADVSPEGVARGSCTVCGRFLVGNGAALVHGLRSAKLAKKIDAYRVDLVEQLFKERGGREALAVAERIAIENYALVCAQHKTIEARLDHDGLFTATGRRRSAFDMLKQISETIDRLRAELPPIATRPATPATDYDALSTKQLADLLAAHAVEAQRAADEEARGRAAIAAAVARVDAGDRPAADTTPDVEPAPAIVESCLFCGLPAARCATIRDDPRWLDTHLERADVTEHLARQRAVRLKWLGSGGVARDGSGITRGSATPEEDPFDVMLESLRREKRFGR
jgi:hypothetical protein